MMSRPVRSSKDSRDRTHAPRLENTTIRVHIFVSLIHSRDPADQPRHEWKDHRTESDHRSDVRNRQDKKSDNRLPAKGRTDATRATDAMRRTLALEDFVLAGRIRKPCHWLLIVRAILCASPIAGYAFARSTRTGIGACHAILYSYTSLSGASRHERESSRPA